MTAKKKYAGKTYGPKTYGSLTTAYNAYQKHRHAQTANPALAPRAKFAQIHGWTKTKKLKRGKTPTTITGVRG